jgi:hypothetical protein
MNSDETRPARPSSFKRATVVVLLLLGLAFIIYSAMLPSQSPVEAQKRMIGFVAGGYLILRALLVRSARRK